MNFQKFIHFIVVKITSIYLMIVLSIILMFKQYYQINNTIQPQIEINKINEIKVDLSFNDNKNKLLEHNKIKKPIKISKYKIKNIKNKNNFLKIRNAPTNISVLDYKLPEIPKNIIDDVTQHNYKLNNYKILGLSSYLIAKGLFIKLFKTDENISDIITDFNSFTQVYKKYIQLKSENKVGYNFCLKFFTLYKTSPTKRINHIYDNHEYLYLLEDTIIKIKNTTPIIYIEKRLDINNVLLTKLDKNLILSYGSYIVCDINENMINNFFSNSTDYTYIKKFSKYNKVKIFFWTSVII
jgi:hypothetical protein